MLARSQLSSLLIHIPRSRVVFGHAALVYHLRFRVDVYSATGRNA